VQRGSAHGADPEPHRAATPVDTCYLLVAPTPERTTPATCLREEPMPIRFAAPQARFHRLRALLALLLAALPLPLLAQPSGGPYGPIPQAYAVPEEGRVYYVAPEGDHNAAGDALARPTSLEAAIARVV